MRLETRPLAPRPDPAARPTPVARPAHAPPLRPAVAPLPVALAPAVAPEVRAAQVTQHHEQLASAQARQAPQLLVGIARALEGLTTAPGAERASLVDRLAARLAAAEQGARGTPHEGAARAQVADALPAIRELYAPPSGSKLDKALARLESAVGGAPVLKSSSTSASTELGLCRVEVEAMASRLEARGQPFERIEVPLGNGLSAPAIKLLPGSTGLSRVAERVGALYGAELVFCPAYLNQQDAQGVFNSTQNRIYLDAPSLDADKLSAVGRHEVRHAYFAARRTTAEKGSIYDSELHSTAVSGLSRRSTIYRNYQSAEELSTWGKNVRDSFEARTGKVDRWELARRASGLSELAQQTEDATGRKLRLIDELLATTSSKALRDATASTPVKSYADGVSIRYLAYTTKVPLVSPEDRKKLDALKAAETTFEALDRQLLPGVFKPKAWSSAKAALDVAQRAVLTAARAKLASLHDLSKTYQTELGGLTALLSRVSTAEHLRYTPAADRAAKLEALRDDPILARIIERAGAGALASDGAWRALAEACVKAAEQALARDGLTRANRIARLSHSTAS